MFFISRKYAPLRSKYFFEKETMYYNSNEYHFMISMRK